MKRRSLHNRRGFAWLLSLAFVLMATVSGASWQCLDGHPCPPGCTMQQHGDQASPNRTPACCRSGQGSNTGTAHCALCTAAHPTNSRIASHCTSPICVLRTQMKPDIDLQVHTHFDFDTVTLPLSLPEVLLLPEATTVLCFGSSRAPPDPGVVRLTSPRAPPIPLL